MRRFLVLCLCVIALPQAGGAVEQSPPYVPKQFLIKFKPIVSACAHCLIAQGRPFEDFTGSGELDELNRRFGVYSARPLFLERHDLSAQQAQGKWQQQVAAVKARFPQRTRRAPAPDGPFADLTNVYLFEVASEDDVPTICAAYANTAVVEYCEPNYLVEAALVPNDPFWSTVGSWGQSFDDLWGLKQIQADLAWDLNQGSGTLVAVTDSGFDFTHPDAGATWTNPGEIAGNGLDDDANGFVDDTRGWDFRNADNDPTDDFGHGTHVTGIINAAINNTTGIVGVAPLSTAMILKTQGNTGSGSLDALAQAITYAAQEGADVINMSLSTSPITTPLTLRDAIDLAHDTYGLVLIASAGNKNRSDVGTEAFGSFPAAFNDVITVAANFNAIWNTLEIANFSNIGAKIDVAAPGAGNFEDPPTAFDPTRNVVSLAAAGATSSFTGSGQLLVPPPSGGGSYVRQAGTSQAAPFVAGTAALIVSQRPELTNEQVRQVLRNSAVDIERPERDRFSGYGRLNAWQALQLGSIPVARLSSPALFSKVKQGVSVEIRGSATSPTVGLSSWTVLVKRLDELTFTQIASGTTPVTDGLFTTWDTSSLTIGQQYVVRLEVQDVNGGIARDSVIVYVRTPVERFTIQQLTSTPLPRHNIKADLNADGTKLALYSTAALDPGKNPGGFQVFLWDAATSLFQQVTFGSGDQLQINLNISADGTQAAFVSTRDLVGTNADRSAEVFFFDQALPAPGIKQLTQTGNHPTTISLSMSGDARWVAFHLFADLVGSNPDLSLELFRVDTLTNATQQLTQSPSGIENARPSLNADGTKVAFDSTDIFLLDITSGLLQQVTKPGISSFMPSLNVDGSFVAFVSSSDLVSPQNADGNQELFVADLNDSSFTQATSTQDVLPGFINIQSWSPAISGDGNRVAFRANANLDPSIGNVFASHINTDVAYQIFLYDVPTHRLYQVSDGLRRFDTSATDEPSVNADGTRIAFHSPGDLDPNVGNPDSNAEMFLATTIDRPPLLDPIGPKTVVATEALSFQVNGSDLDLDPLTFSASDLPAGATFTPATRTFSWTPTEAQIRPTPYFVRFVVDDATFGDMEDVPITVVDPPPTLAPIGNRTVNAGQLLQFTVSASDPNPSQTLALSATNLPSGASFPTVQGTGNVTGTFSWTPPLCSPTSPPPVTFTVTDGQASPVSETVTITVQNSNCPPTISISGPTCSGDVCKMYEQSPSAFEALSFSVTATDPDGVTSLGPALAISGKLIIVPTPPSAPGSTFNLSSQTNPSVMTGTMAWSQISAGTPVSFAALGSCGTTVPVTFVASTPQQQMGSRAITIQLVKCGEPGNTGCAAAVPHPPLVLSATTRGQLNWHPTPETSFLVWDTGQVGLGRPFQLSGSACDPDSPTEVFSYAWSYQGSNPPGVAQSDLNLQNLNQQMATGTSPSSVSQATSLSFQLQVTDSTSRSSLPKGTFITVRPDCFIATAAYGTALAPELDILRAYRDDVLAHSWLGRTFTELYYRTSPPVARFIAGKPFLRALVRQLLRPVIRWAKRQLGAAHQ